MKDKYKELACEFLNESECKEEIEGEGLDLNSIEKEHYQDGDEDIQFNHNKKSDEAKFLELINKGVDAKTAAHIINRESEKHLKTEEFNIMEKKE